MKLNEIQMAIKLLKSDKRKENEELCSETSGVSGWTAMTLR